jgi:hypothetical protein
MEQSKKIILKYLLTSLESVLTPERIFQFHLFLCSLGLVGMTGFIASLIVARIFPSRSSYVVSDYIIPFFYSSKPLELIQYILIIAVLGIYYLFVILFSDRISARLMKRASQNFWYHQIFICLASIVVNVCLLNPPNTAKLHRFIYALISWLIVLVLPFKFYITDFLVRLGIRIVSFLNRFSLITKVRLCQFGISDLKTFILCVLLFILSAQFIHMFLPFVTSPLHVMNSFLDIPEHTFLNSSINPSNNEIFKNILVDDRPKDKKSCFENIAFINDHFLFGNVNRYSIQSDGKRDPYPKPGSYVSSLNEPKYDFLQDQSQNDSLLYYFNNRIQAFTAISKFPDGFAQASIFIPDYVQRKEIRSVVESTNRMEKYLKKRVLSAAEKEFMRANIFEIHWQILNRWAIHHHNFVLGPINEYNLGKSLKDLCMQYGFFSVIVGKTVLNAMGGITFSNYFTALYSIYYLYYALLIAVSFVIFRNIRYVLLSATLFFATLNAIGFHFLYISPGLNPIRHFFDVFVILFLFLYSRHNRLIYIYLAVAFGLIGILNNAQIGLFCYLALLVTYVVKNIFEKQMSIYTYVHAIIFSVLGGLIYLYASKIGNPGISPYYLMGLLGFPNKFIVLIAICCAFIYYLLFLIAKKDHKSVFLPFFLFIYSQGLLFYFVWGTTVYHFLNFACIYVLFLISILHLLVNHSLILKMNQRYIINILLICSMLFYLKSTVNYYHERAEYDSIFRSHIEYDWVFEKMRIKSTMPPQFFSNSRDLIHKYSSDSGIYIISKYDSVLPFLSDRYSRMPFFELSYFLVTPKEIRECIYLLEKDKPEYLYVDTDIDRHFNVDIISPNVPVLGYLHEESVWRVQRLNLLKEIFNAVRNNYEPVEEGSLITVYRRKTV